MTQGPTDAPVHLGRYELLGEIASGGMATVFLARSSGAGGFTRLVAIKRLHPHLEAEEEFVRMFLDEARLAARIRHPNVVGTLDVEDRDGLYIVMEFIEGVTLLQLTREAQKAGERLPVPVAIRIALDTLAGLHAAHELRDENDVFLNLVHRDVSPQNILLGTDGTARLTDFGIAKASSRLSLTRDGQLKGKISYMAPEQTRRGEALDRRADVFAMGAVVWEVLAGRRLFHGESDVEVLNQLLFEPVPRLREFAPTLPSMLEGAVMKALERDASARYATAAQFAEALERATRMLGGAANHRVVSSFVQRVAGERIARERSRISLGSIPPDAPLTGSLRASLTPAPAPTPSHVRPAFNAGAERPSVPRARLRAPTMTGPVYAPPPGAPAEPAADPAPRPQTPASPLRARSRPPSPLRPPTLPAAPHGAAEERTFIPTVPPPPSPSLPAVIEFDISEDPDAAPVPAPSPLRAATRPGLMPTPLPPPPAPVAPPTPDDSQRLPPIELSYQHVPAAQRLPHAADEPMEADTLEGDAPEPVPAALRSVPPAPIEPVRPPPPMPEAPRPQALALKPEVPTLRPEALNPPESTRPVPVAPVPSPPSPAAPAPLDEPPAAPRRTRTGLWAALALLLVVTVGSVVGLYAAGLFEPVRYPVADVRVRARPPAPPDDAAVDAVAAAAVDVLASPDGAPGDATALDDATAPDDATAATALDATDDAAVEDAGVPDDAPPQVDAGDAGDDAVDAAADDAGDAAREERRRRRRHRRHRDDDDE